jgi:F-type H+-transporting ATPase subunit delta
MKPDVDVDTAQHPFADVGAMQVARVYAEALLSSAQEKGQAAEILQDLQALVEQVLSNAELADFFASAAVGREKKAAVLSAAFKDRAPPLLVEYLQVLNKHDRLGLLRPIAISYKQQLDRRNNLVRVHVTSAKAVPDDQLDRLKRLVRDTTQREPVVDVVIDPSLVGGLVVRVGDWVFDASVTSRLESLRNKLIESSSHEIASGRDRFYSET